MGDGGVDPVVTTKYGEVEPGTQVEAQFFTIGDPVVTVQARSLYNCAVVEVDVVAII